MSFGAFMVAIVIADIFAELELTVRVPQPARCARMFGWVTDLLPGTFDGLNTRRRKSHTAGDAPTKSGAA
jgi:hypothetical protein